MLQKPISCALVLILVSISVLFIFSNASAAVKSETISVNSYDDFSFTLQLNGGDTVYWEWSVSSDSTWADLIVDFTIKDPDNECVVIISGKSSDKGNAVIDESNTYVFTWDLQDYLTLAYTITYEPYNPVDPKDTEISDLESQVEQLQEDNTNLESGNALLVSSNNNYKEENEKLNEDLEAERASKAKYLGGGILGFILACVLCPVALYLAHKQHIIEINMDPKKVKTKEPQAKKKKKEAVREIKTPKKAKTKKQQ